MNTLIRPLTDVRRTLDIDLVADFTCPWSWLGMAQLTRALGNLEGDVETRLRWHPFRMAPKAATTNPRSFHDYLAERLPAGISVPFAERSLTEAGRELGLDFHCLLEQLDCLGDRRFVVAKHQRAALEVALVCHRVDAALRSQ